MVFRVEDCAALELEAMRAALNDATQRAMRDGWSIGYVPLAASFQSQKTSPQLARSDRREAASPTQGRPQSAATT